MEEPYLNIPLVNLFHHELWEARLEGYKLAKNIFIMINDEESLQWNEFSGVIKHFVVDSNAVAQESGLEAALLYVENCAAAEKTVGEVMTGIVTKCVAAPNAKIKDLALQISLKYIEIGEQKAVMEELRKGTKQKDRKIVIACITIITQAIREFGVNVVTVKPLLEHDMPAFLHDGDGRVRKAGTAMAGEIFRWIGPRIKYFYQRLNEHMVIELEVEFKRVKSGKAVPTRYLRSQQAKQAKIAAEAEKNEESMEFPHWNPPHHGTNQYSFVPATNAHVQPNTVFVGKDKDGSRLYAGRAHHEGDLIPAKVAPNYGKAFVAWGGQEHSKSRYEVLVTAQAAWKYAENGNVPQHALVFGQTKTGESLYLGRAQHNGALIPGKVQKNHGCLYISYAGEEIAYKEYEVLILV